jgi:preprotein translocase subunit SecG
MINEILIVIYVLVALMLIGMVLIQQGKGADMGASFGGGGSNTVFGSTGSGNFMTRTTAILATLFFVISLILGNQAANQEQTLDEWENLEAPALIQPADSDVPVVETVQPADSDVPSFEVQPVNSDVPVVEEESDEDVPN